LSSFEAAAAETVTQQAERLMKEARERGDVVAREAKRRSSRRATDRPMIHPHRLFTSAVLTPAVHLLFTPAVHTFRPMLPSSMPDAWSGQRLQLPAPDSLPAATTRAPRAMSLPPPLTTPAGYDAKSSFLRKAAERPVT